MPHRKKAVAAPVEIEKKPPVTHLAHSEPIPGDAKSQCDAAAAILAAYQALQQHAGTTLAYALHLGRALTRLRDSFRHKAWGQFRKRALERGGVSNTTIKRYIQMWRGLSPEKAELLPESLEEIKAGIDKLELPAATVSGVYRAFGMVSKPAKSGNESGKEYRGLEKDGRLKFDDARTGCQWLATMNDSLPALTEIADCKNPETKAEWAAALTPIVDVAEAVGIEPKKRNRVTDTTTATAAIQSVALWLQQQGHSLSDADRESILDAIDSVQTLAKPAGKASPTAPSPTVKETTVKETVANPATPSAALDTVALKKIVTDKKPCRSKSVKAVVNEAAVNATVSRWMKLLEPAAPAGSEVRK